MNSDPNSMLDKVAKLDLKRRKLFDILLSENATNLCITRRTPLNKAAPMSFAQRRLWFLHLLNPNTPAYNCPIPLKLTGPLDCDALCASAAAIVARHDVLRARFSMVDGRPIQQVDDTDRFNVKAVDLSGERQDAYDNLQERIKKDILTPFDLTASPPIRAELIRLAADKHVFLFDIHHIANDHGSIRVFLGELAEGYSARLTQRMPELPDLAIQYSDYAFWQQEKAAFQKWELEWAYWRENLKGFVPLTLPTDRPHPAHPTSNGEVRKFALGEELVERLREIGRSDEASLFVVLLAAFKLLLSRYCRTDDIAVGCSATSRNRAELQNLIGFFVNTIILRTKIDQNASFRSTLRNVRETVKSGFAHSDFPFDLLVKRLNPSRSANKIPLAPVMFTLDDTPEDIPSFPSLDTEIIEPEFLTSKFDLLFNVRPRDGGVYGHIQYNTDVFDHETIDAMASHYETILESICAEAECQVLDLEIFPDTERKRVLIDWNDTGQKIPDSCLHKLIEERALEQPDAIAVIDAERHVSYSELLALANAAQETLEGKVGPGSLVALAYTQSLDLIAAILAVLRVGAAYLPLDVERDLKSTCDAIELLGVDSLIAETASQNRFEQAGLSTIQLDKTGDGKGVIESDHDDPDSHAYVIFSSGSTGAPKAIELRHRGVANNIGDINRRFNVGSGDRTLLLSSPAFDMSVYETIGMLIGGATSVVVPNDAIRSPSIWLDMLSDHKITIWNSAPVLLELLVEAHERRAAPTLNHLRLVLLGGDWIPVSLIARVQAMAPNAQIVALGGATEASIHSTIHMIDLEIQHDDLPSISYGRPMANQRTYILDRQLRPVPIGVPGELHIAGVGLATGYRNNEEMTQSRFIERTIEGRKERLFKTGDLARWKFDQEIELIGRIDLQAKVHGQWVDLKAIELALRDCAGVADAVVVINRAKTTGIVAHVILDEHAQMTLSELRGVVRNKLPANMVPNSFVEHKAFPLSANGKVDRIELTKLPLPSMHERSPHKRNELETKLSSVICSVLGLATINRDANFFAHGCDSLSVIRIAQAVGNGVSVIDIFDWPSVAALAHYLQARDVNEISLLNRLTKHDGRVSTALVCVPYGGGTSSSYIPLAGVLPSDIALWSVALPGHEPGRPNEKLATIAETARRCVDEILALDAENVVLFGQCAGSAVAIHIARILEQMGNGPLAVIVGGALPDTDPAHASQFASQATDAELHDYLREIGAFDKSTDDQTVKAMLSSVRHDLVHAAQYFSDAFGETNIKTPLFCFFGDRDQTTQRFVERSKSWFNFANSVNCDVIRDSDHYFSNRNPEELSILISATIDSLLNMSDGNE